MTLLLTALTRKSQCMNVSVYGCIIYFIKKLCSCVCDWYGTQSDSRHDHELG